ncbi:M48 family metalloprotease [Streptomyces sp. NBC_00503]|uniref:M48 family metalloprotease n=1 Tax=Streptomyces sp. NBC_00503 TaxID=2903659 RepID=UPI002E820FCC|nr:M48 family metalloprotease [Streptomyces sp. NBC_00503]WUD79250.1 M48 family metalloprotease [Streptomyces sp. NBC_00503]
MNAASARPRIDERALGAGTTTRFAMLVALILAASEAIVLLVVRTLNAADGVDCLLAAGMDPDRVGDAVAVSRLGAQWIPFWACMDQSAPLPPWWQLAVMPVLLVLTAALVFLLLPAWKIRRRRLVALHTLDTDGAVLRLVQEAVDAAGLAKVPRIVVDRAAPTAGAVVFGRTRRPTVSLHGGLLAYRSTDPARVRTVLLHELAHIVNRDISVTYGTVALWRTFVTLVLLPYLIWSAVYINTLELSTLVTTAPYEIRTLLFPLLLVALVHLARADVLRAREIHADLAAARWGADLHRAMALDPAPRGLRSAAGSLKELWSTHPPTRLRQSALSDPAPLFGLRPLPVLLTGVSAVLIHGHLLSYLATYRRFSAWILQGTAFIPALLVCGVIGIALWRAVAYAVITGRPAPSGLRTGLWLGAGLGTGALCTGFGAGVSQWWIGGPAGLLLVVAAGTAFTVWVTQCARLWAGSWRGRSLRPALVLCLTAGFVVASVWFTWQTTQGIYGSFWQSIGTGGSRQSVLRMFPGATDTGHPAVAATAVVLPLLLSSVSWPLFTAAASAIWLVPALPLALGPTGDSPRWVARARLDGDLAAARWETPPPLRRALGPGLLGGTGCWLAVAGVQDYLHHEQAGPAPGLGMATLRYLALTFVALAGALAVTAVWAGRGRHLLVTLVATQTAATIGLAGTVLLMSLDGCVAPLSVRNADCGWRPAWQALPDGYLFGFVNLTLLLAALIAVLTTLLPAVVAAFPRRRRARPGPAAGRCPSGGRSVRSVARWSAVGLPMALALALAVAEPLVLAKYQTALPNYAAGQRSFQQLLGDSPPPTSPRTRARQVNAWYWHGGGYLLGQAVRTSGRLKAVDVPLEADQAEARARALARIRSLCVELGNLAAWEDGYYFRVPDAEIQSEWHDFGRIARDGSRDCLSAVDRQPFDTNAFLDLALARFELDVADSHAENATMGITEILRKEGYRT